MTDPQSLPIQQNHASRTKTIIIIMSVLLLASLGYIGITKMKSNYDLYVYNMTLSSYNKGLQDGALSIIKDINEKGLIPIISDNTIQNIPIQQICEVLK